MGKYKKQLIQALDYAGQTGSFNKRNIIENAENVCIYGLGTYFEAAFIRHNVRERFKVTMLCDNNRQRLAEVAVDARYSGLKCVSPEDIPKNTAVVMMLGDPRSALRQLKMRRNICSSEEDYNNLIIYDTLVFDDIMDGIREKDKFVKCKSDILKVFEMLYDEESKRVFVNALCNRIAPQYSQYDSEELCTFPSYFPKIPSLSLPFGKNEAFVDCGAYIGDTIDIFLNVTLGQFERIDAFELDGENFKIMQEHISRIDKSFSSKIRLWPGGVAEHDGVVKYGKMSGGTGYSIYNPREVTTAKVFSLDSALGKERVTMIKMDIEGAELSALKGAKEIIQTQKPKMAICIYHRLEDAWQIPLYLKELVPEYKISVRKHEYQGDGDTVCYAYL